MAMRGAGNRLNWARREFVKNLAWMLAAFGALGVILVFATQLPLVGVLAFVGIFASVLAALVTVVALWSGSYDETLLSGHKHHSGAPPDRGGDWAGGAGGDGGGAGDGGGGGW